jgi:PAS domain S-box-containing protein
MPKRAAPGAPPIPGIEDLPEPVIVTDLDHVIVDANAAALAFLGYAKGAVVGWPFDRIMPARPKGVSLLVGGGGGRTKFESKVRTKAGKLVLASFLAAPVVRGGKPAFIVYLARDIRVRKLLEAEVRKSRDYFRTIVENSPSGICVTDLGRRIVMANRAAEEITGYSVAELAGSNVAMFYPADVKGAMPDLAALRRGEQPMREFLFRRKDGATVPVLASYRLVEDEHGEREMIIETYSDQSDRKRLAKLRNEFVYVAAHELKNPVSAIRALLDVIFDDKRITIEPLMRSYLLKVQEADERLLQLVDDLLEVSRGESGRLKINVSSQDMAEHVAQIFSELKPTALGKDVTLDYVPLVRNPKVLADPMKLKEVLANLISNAIKYNVSDTGIGIGKEDTEHLFEKFWRSEDMAVRAQPGTGLGLFIVKELVERMGGKMTVDSKRGKGTTFTFTLPLAGKR